jgi:hypothetical protein
MKNKFNLPLVSLSLICLCSPSNAIGGRDYAGDAFRSADFVPHVYDDSQIVAAYGAGKNSRSNDGACTRTYSDKQKRWVSFSGDCDLSPKERTIDEIMVGRAADSTAGYPYRGNLSGISLFGVSLGDSRQKAMAAAKGRYGLSVTIEKFQGRRVEQIYFFHGEDDTDLYYRYLVSSGRVVAFAIGVTE